MVKTNTNWNVVKIFEKRAKKVDSKEHFHLQKYQVTMKEIAQVRYGTHCKYNINYHFVWIPKTRMNVLVSPFKEKLEQHITEYCKKQKWFALALQVMPDHVHFFMSAHPKWAPMRIIQQLKQYTSKKLREEYSILRSTRTTPDFWATGYYCGTAGHVSAEQVARYILEQTQKLQNKWHLFDLKPFEYDITEASLPKSQIRLDAFGIGGFDSVLR